MEDCQQNSWKALNKWLVFICVVLCSQWALCQMPNSTNYTLGASVGPTWNNNPNYDTPAMNAGVNIFVSRAITNRLLVETGIGHGRLRFSRDNFYCASECPLRVQDIITIWEVPLLLKVDGTENLDSRTHWQLGGGVLLLSVTEKISQFQYSEKTTESDFSEESGGSYAWGGRISFEVNHRIAPHWQLGIIGNGDALAIDDGRYSSVSRYSILFRFAYLF